MNKNNRIVYIIVSVGIAIIITSFILILLIYFKEEMKKDKINEKETYLSLNETTQEFKGLIIKRTLSAHWAGTYLYDLSTNQKFHLSGLTLNRSYEKKYQDLITSLHTGDSIFKPKNSDTLYVYRKRGDYYYIIGKQIN